MSTTQHILHLMLSVVTGGFWIPVWGMFAAFGRHAKAVEARSKSTHWTTWLIGTFIVFVMVGPIYLLFEAFALAILQQ